MGIDVRVETEDGKSVQEVGDPRGLTSWLLALGDISQTVCLRFIDPYGDTVFNQAQLPVLSAELADLGPSLTDLGLLKAKQEHLEGAKAWPPQAQQEERAFHATLTIGELQQHLAAVTDLIDHAQGRIHHYVRFFGD